MEDKKYIVSGEYLGKVREAVKTVMKMVAEEPLIFDVKRAKMLNRMSEVVEMLCPENDEKELVEHVCRCGHGGNEA